MMYGSGFCLLDSFSSSVISQASAGSSNPDEGIGSPKCRFGPVHMIGVGAEAVRMLGKGCQMRSWR